MEMRSFECKECNKGYVREECIVYASKNGISSGPFYFCNYCGRVHFRNGEPANWIREPVFVKDGKLSILGKDKYFQPVK